MRDKDFGINCGREWKRKEDLRRKLLWADMEREMKIDEEVEKEFKKKGVAFSVIIWTIIIVWFIWWLWL